MTDHPPSDHSGQVRRADAAIRHRSRPHGGGHDLTLSYTGITDIELARLLDAVQSITTLPPLPAKMDAYLRVIAPAARERARRRKRLHPGGQPKGPTHDPGFIALVAQAAVTHREQGEKAPTTDVMAGLLGVGRTAYSEWLTRNRLRSTDIKLISSSRTVSDGISLLRGLQKKRRQQRI